VPRAEPSADEGKFERDTAVHGGGGEGPERAFSAEVSPDWRAGRGPHGGYLSAMIQRALEASVGDPERTARSLTIHFARAPEPGAVAITTTVEREGTSLSTLSARMEQDGKLIALVLAAFSRAWSGPEIAEEPMPQVAPPDPERVAGAMRKFGAPPFTEHVVLQRRFGPRPFSGPDPDAPMEAGGWIGLGEPHVIDAPLLAFFADALVPAPFMRTGVPAPAPTIDLTVHFRVALPREGQLDPHELCLARTRASVIHEGFFVEDGVIWAQDGTLLAESRQLAILLDRPMS
jgi:acyl-CoA thioesterase